MNRLTQEELDDKYLEYCKTGDFDGIKLLNKKYPPSNGSLFSSFLKIIQFNKPSLDFLCNDYEGLFKLAENGNTEIISYITSQPSFKLALENPLFPSQNINYNMNSNKTILNAIKLAAKNGHFECADLLMPFEKELKDRVPLHIAFLDACANGDLNLVKFLINSKKLSYHVPFMINDRLTSAHAVGECFIDACRHGHLNIVRYLTSDTDLDEKIDLNLIEEEFNVDNHEIIQYLVFDLNLPKEHKIFSLITCSQENLISELLTKRQLFEDISQYLNITPTQVKAKKPKL